MTLEHVLYTARAPTTGGRNGGDSHTDDGRLDVKLSSLGRSGCRHQPRAAVRHTLVRSKS
jgi:hypothetical protein